MRPLLANRHEQELLRSSITRITQEQDELASRSYMRFIQNVPDVTTPIRHRTMRKLNEMLIETVIAFGSTGCAEGQFESLIALVTNDEIRPRHLAILANAILTTAGKLLDSDWSVEIEAVWDEALHNLVAQVVRARVDANR